MAIMAWSPHFETGLVSVDAEHHALVNMVNEVAPHLALDSPSARQLVQPLLDKLTYYAGTHFLHEEALMAERQMCPEYLALHHQSHVAFVDEVVSMRHQFEERDGLSGPAMLRFLTSWLSFHILAEDQRMATQLHAMEAGRTPEQAFEDVKEADNAPHAVYTSSLLDLFTLLTERNHKLIQANESVRRSQAALEAANQSLEVRVQERTRDLAESITRLEQTQNQLLQSEKLAAVGQLAAGVAHEINNPIGFVTSNMGSLSDYVAQLFELIDTYQGMFALLPAEQRASLEVVRQRIEIDYLREDIPSLLKESRDGLARVKRIVTDLRDFSHSDSGQWAEADLTQSVESALNIAANEVKYKANVERQWVELPPVMCIASQINQVLVNLLVNAAQAIDSKGVITVRSGLDQDNVWLEVSDTGCGMSEAVQKRIFEPFYTTKPVGKGTGLGLSITWEIIQRHHGQIEVHSTPGVGTTFRITLPKVQPVAVPATTATE